MKHNWLFYGSTRHTDISNSYFCTVIQRILKATNNILMHCAVAVYMKHIFAHCIILQNIDINFSIAITKECVSEAINKTSNRETDKVYMLPFHSSFKLWLAESIWVL